MDIQKLGSRTAEQKAKHAAYMRRYTAANSEKINAQKRIRYYQNHERSLETARRQRAKPSRQAYMKAFRKMHYARTRKEDLAKNKIWRENNKHRVLVTVKKWQSENYERHLMNQRRSCQRRRARKNGNFTWRYPGDFEQILKKFNYSCAYCRKQKIKLTEDHQIPISWGGHDAPWNIVPACCSCNARKHARFWELS